MATAPGKHATHNSEFCLKEYESLRKEIEWLSADERTVERNAVIAVGATWAWLFAHPVAINSTKWVWCIPVLFVILGAHRFLGILKKYSIFHAYLKEVEDVFSAEGAPGGWENFSWGKKGWVLGSGHFFWIILLVVVVVVAIHQWFFSN